MTQTRRPASAENRRGPRGGRPTPITMTVLRSTGLTEHLIRIHLGGPGFADFTPSDYTDSYVKLAFPRADGTEAIRSYTVRAVDTAARELIIDFVHHGDNGIAGRWAAAARPGDTLVLRGPRGAYAPRADVDYHLLAGDESALPAIATALEAMSPDAHGHAFIEVAGPADELELSHPAGVGVTWLHRGTQVAGRLLAREVRALPWPAGRVQLFVHGEAGAVMQDLRGYLRTERGTPTELASISGYWRHGQADEDYRQWKRTLPRMDD